MNRLILNLTQTANVREESESLTRTGFEPPMFASNSILGNIGAPVDIYMDYPNDNALEDGNKNDEEFCSGNDAGA